jgi:S-adenosylmethionine hydrolase
VSGAIRQVDPQAQIGMDINAENVRWGNYVLQQLAGYYDRNNILDKPNVIL